jgi:hypothetical protein
VVERREIDRDVVAFIRTSLSRGAAVSRLLLELPLEEGHVFAFLPKHVGKDVARRFDLGGVFRQEESIEAERRVAEFVASYLNRSEHAYAIFENPVMRTTDPSTKRSDLCYFTFDDGVYFFLSPGQTELTKVIATMRGVHSWVLNGILAVPKGLGMINTRQHLDREALVNLAMNSEYLLVGAYDHEGYLIWSRR